MKGTFSAGWHDFLVEWTDAGNSIVAHTSGSTGMPKEIRLSKVDMLLSARSTNERFGITSGSKLLCPLSPDYIAGKMMMVRAIAAGCELFTETPSNTPFIRDYGSIDLMAVVPSQCQSLIQNELAKQRLKNLIVGGAPLTGELEHALAGMPWRTFATYGMTETCSHVALRELGTDRYEAMPGIRFSQDERGCLVIMADAFSFRRLVTNDEVELLDAGTFRWLGRHDNAINSGGVKFHPEQLEKLIEGVFKTPFYFKGMPDEKWGEAVAMVIEASGDDNEALCNEALEICRRLLPRYAVPKHITVLPHLPRASNGKLRRI